MSVKNLIQEIRKTTTLSRISKHLKLLAIPIDKKKSNQKSIHCRHLFTTQFENPNITSILQTSHNNYIILLAYVYLGKYLKTSFHR